MPEGVTTKVAISFQEAFKLYEDGKHRRYELLFAVNGGAFAIVKVMWDKGELGGLRLPYVALGMVLFTITMVVDIYKFGDNWHSIGKEITACKKYEIFGSVGRRVLIAIGLLLCLAWTLASGLLRSLVP